MTDKELRLNELKQFEKDNVINELNTLADLVHLDIWSEGEKQSIKDHIIKKLDKLA